MGQGTLQWLVFMVSVTGFRVTRPLVSAPLGTSARVFLQDELSGNAVLNVGSSIPETHQSRKRRALIRSGSQFGRFSSKSGVQLGSVAEQQGMMGTCKRGSCSLYGWQEAEKRRKDHGSNLPLKDISPNFFPLLPPASSTSWRSHLNTRTAGDVWESNACRPDPAHGQQSVGEKGQRQRASLHSETEPAPLLPQSGTTAQGSLSGGTSNTQSTGCCKTKMASVLF